MFLFLLQFLLSRVFVSVITVVREAAFIERENVISRLKLSSSLLLFSSLFIFFLFSFSLPFPAFVSCGFLSSEIDHRDNLTTHVWNAFRSVMLIFFSFFLFIYFSCFVLVVYLLLPFPDPHSDHFLRGVCVSFASFGLSFIYFVLSR